MSMEGYESKSDVDGDDISDDTSDFSNNKFSKETQ